MNIILIGSGGREHAIAWKLNKSKILKNLYVIPGNCGISRISKRVKNINIDIYNDSELEKFVKEKKIDFSIVGPEEPLSRGISDKFLKLGVPCLGPSKKASKIESSKIFSKKIMEECGIPTSNYKIFSEFNSSIKYLEKIKIYPIVIKLDGLASGKGVFIVNNISEGKEVLKKIFKTSNSEKLKKKIIIEDFIKGKEASFIVISDGKKIIPLDSSQDHKTKNDFGKGPNTGGMGAYSPIEWINKKLKNKIYENVVNPVIKKLYDMKIPYRGFLYVGLMITGKESFKVLEFNCRLGDPEAQVILPRLKNDLIEILEFFKNESIHKIKLKWNPKISLGLVVTSKNYPKKFKKSYKVYGIKKILKNKKITIFYSGIKYIKGNFFTSSGRVFCIVCLSNNISIARTKIFKIIKQIKFKDMYFRKDIGISGI